MSNLQRKLDTQSAEHKESVAKWAKDHPTLPPGHDPKGPTWKSVSKVRRPTEAFRSGYAGITWSN